MLAFLIASIGCVIMLAGRYAVTGSIHYAFLVWNLFLAWIPYTASSWLVIIGEKPGKTAAAVSAVLGAVWLLFIPNAPYILTDFIHIIVQPYPSGSDHGFLSGRPILWYDIILTASFAFIGHLIGLVSMTHIHHLVRERFSSGAAWILIGAVILLSGYGIYIGRFQRLNSWNIFTNPGQTIMVILRGVLYLKGVLFSLAVAFFIFLTYIPLYFSSNSSGPRRF